MRSFLRASRTAFLLLSLVAAAVAPARAESVNTIYAFTNSVNGPDGGTPEPGLILSTNGLLYGATVNGGSNGWGALFHLTTTGTLTPWHAFNYTPDGASPAGGVIRGTNGLYYGATPLTGAASTNQGSIYQISAAGAFTTLYSFPGLKNQTNTTGAKPAGSLVQGTNGQFYGVTSAAGLRTNGTIFSVSSSGQFTLRYTFTNGFDGGKPLAGLFLSSNGNFYGTTSSGGSNGAGTIFKLSHAGVVTPLYSFTANDGSSPLAPLVQTANGLLIGAASAGGSNSSGTIFQITTNGAFQLLYVFTTKTNTSPNQNPDGASPRAIIVNQAGSYYGVASAGGTNGEGSIFEITPDGEFLPVYSFLALSFGSPATNLDGANPNGILQAPDGSYYVTTAHGGAGYGTVGHVLVPVPPILVSFSNDKGALAYANGQFQLLLTNIPSSTVTVIIQASDDLINWTPILTNATPAAQSPFTDTAARNFPARFYRALVTP